MNLLIIQCLLQQKAIYAHALWYSFMTYGSLKLIVEVIDQKMDIVIVAWCLKALSS